ncbi:hypothetical protein WN51_10849 [Melipona quadrifasciata]|uniref:PiggyBac transposable element-derived protein 4 C-terminal zinc-finger domain-containing protein n=1 Tax=Melipona quadrifasciata TaxID=166423 RepID=A0A0M9A714_9HYME|nr:hypothetical protein WN51_10849 [Melipona quadrifasciata]
MCRVALSSLWEDHTTTRLDAIEETSSETRSCGSCAIAGFSVAEATSGRRSYGSRSLVKIPGRAKVCALCMQNKIKAASGRGKQTTFKCKQCDLPLCQTGCFLEYHQERNVDTIGIVNAIQLFFTRNKERKSNEPSNAEVQSPPTISIRFTAFFLLRNGKITSETNADRRLVIVTLWILGRDGIEYLTGPGSRPLAFKLEFTGRVYRDNGRDGWRTKCKVLHAAATSGHDFPNISFDSESRGGEGMGLGAAADRVPGLTRSQVGNGTENCATGFFPGGVIVAFFERIAKDLQREGGAVT